MSKLLPIFAGAGLGGVLRYWIGTLVQSSLAGSPQSAATAFPWGTLIVNVTGCLAIGVLAAIFASPAHLHRDDLKAALIVGLLGGYTTFSSFGRETLALVALDRWSLAALYVLASNALGLGAVWVGLALAKRTM